MASAYVGVLVGVISRRLYAIINPDEDGELDNPRFWLIQNEEKEPVALVRVPREAYMAATSPEEVERLVASVAPA